MGDTTNSQTTIAAFEGLMPRTIAVPRPTIPMERIMDLANASPPDSLLDRFFS
jgi:hypothetical protein